MHELLNELDKPWSFLIPYGINIFNLVFSELENKIYARYRLMINVHVDAI